MHVEQHEHQVCKGGKLRAEELLHHVDGRHRHFLRFRSRCRIRQIIHGNTKRIGKGSAQVSQIVNNRAAGFRENGTKRPTFVSFFFSRSGTVFARSLGILVARHLVIERVECTDHGFLSKDAGKHTHSSRPVFLRYTHRREHRSDRVADFRENRLFGVLIAKRTVGTPAVQETQHGADHNDHFAGTIEE